MSQDAIEFTGDVTSFDVWEGTTPLFRFTIRGPVTPMSPHFSVGVPSEYGKAIDLTDAEVKIAAKEEMEDASVVFSKSCDVDQPEEGKCSVRLDKADLVGDQILTVQVYFYYTGGSNSGQEFLAGEFQLKVKKRTETGP